MSSQNDDPNGIGIQTFVFLDLETTGFIQGSNIPKITEMSLVASSRDSLLFNKDGTLPRVMHKLTIPLQPLRFIPLIVSQVTGLYNDLLEHEKPFDDLVHTLLHSFIQRLHTPVCFVAHNGNQFDYPILMSALSHIGKTLPDDILCVDSLIGFRILLQNFNHTDNHVLPNAVENFSKFIDDDHDAALAMIVDFHSISSPLTETENMDISIRDKSEMDVNCRSMQEVNETTPTHRRHSQMNVNAHALSMGNTPSAKKRLQFTSNKPVDFKLDTVHKYLVGTPPPNAHSAEGDCLSLLLCIIKIGESFVRWADVKAIPLTRFATIQK